MTEQEQLIASLTRLFRDRKGEAVLEGGKKVYTLACQSGELRARLPFARNASSSLQRAAESEEDRAKAEAVPAGKIKIRGTASSTSEDWYGTQMSAACLLGMQEQFNKGIGIFPSHGSWFSGLEWDAELGRSVMAVLEAMPTDGLAEQGYKLCVESLLSAKLPKVQELAERLEEGQPIGMSIGGWFREIRYIMDEDDEELEAIIVEKVELDHLAITRNPANPDCTDLQVLRSLAAAALKRAAPVPVVEAPVVVLDPVMIRATEPAPEAPSAERTTTGYADLPIADEAETWDWTTEAQDAILATDNWSRYEKAHFWMNPDGDPKTKDAYKLPFAKLIDGTLKAVWKGVSAAMAALNGARGGVDIPSADRDDVYAHIKRYYTKFGKEIPALKALSAPEPDNNSNSPVVAPVTESGNSTGETPVEYSMTPEEMQAQIEEAVRRALAAAGVVRTAETPDQKIARLEAENTALRTQGAIPQRRGIRYEQNTRTMPVTGFGALISRAKELLGAEAPLVQAIERHAPMLQVDLRARGEAGKRAQEFMQSADTILHDILDAADSDGSLDLFLTMQ